MYIHDPRFITTIYRDFGHRAVAGRANQLTIARLHIEVTEGRQTIDALRIAICDDATERIVLGYHWLRGATVLTASSHDEPLFDINDREKTSDRIHNDLSKCLSQFCRRHGVLDRDGTISERIRKGA